MTLSHDLLTTGGHFRWVSRVRGEPDVRYQRARVVALSSALVFPPLGPRPTVVIHFTTWYVFLYQEHGRCRLIVVQPDPTRRAARRTRHDNIHVRLAVQGVPQLCRASCKHRVMPALPCCHPILAPLLWFVTASINRLALLPAMKHPLP